MSKQAMNLVQSPVTMLDVAGAKPSDALRRLKDTLPLDKMDRVAWARHARIAAVLGNCPKSLESFKSGSLMVLISVFTHHYLCSTAPGLRNWCDFAAIFYGCSERGFPPELEGIVCWSHTFRCVGTFTNYLGYLRNACLALDISAPPVDHPLLRRAKGAIVKKMVHSPRRDHAVL